MNPYNNDFTANSGSVHNYTFLPMKLLRANELRESVSSPVHTRRDNKIEGISFAIVDTEGGVTQQKVGVPIKKTEEMWNKIVLLVAKKMFAELYKNEFVLCKYNSTIKNLSYEIWTCDADRTPNPYIGKLLSPGICVYGHAVIFRRIDADQLASGKDLYQSVSQKQLSKFFNDSTNERKREKELARLRKHSNRLTDPVSRVRDQSAFPVHRTSFPPGMSIVRSPRIPFRQKQEGTKRPKQLGDTESSNMPSDNNDNFAYRTSSSFKSSKRSKKVSCTEKNNEKEIKSSVFTRDDKFPLVSNIVSDGRSVSRKRNESVKMQTREITPSGRRRSTRIRKKTSRK